MQVQKSVEERGKEQILFASIQKTFSGIKCFELEYWVFSLHSVKLQLYNVSMLRMHIEGFYSISTLVSGGTELISRLDIAV